MGISPDEWLETIKKCQYLPEPDIKKLCEMVSWFGRVASLEVWNAWELVDWGSLVAQYSHGWKMNLGWLSKINDVAQRAHVSSTFV